LVKESKIQERTREIELEKAVKKAEKIKRETRDQLSEAYKTGRPQFEELTDVWYFSASGGWKESST